MADSSTEATPSMISPSDGMNSPADTRTTSPARSFELGTCSVRSPSTMRLAMVSERAFRSVSACALPRPSAMASAKLANSTVNHSHSVICRLKPKVALVAEQQHRGDHAADFHHEHDGIAHHVARIQLEKGIQDRAPDDLPVPNLLFRTLACHFVILRKSFLPPSAGAQGSVPG